MSAYELRGEHRIEPLGSAPVGDGEVIDFWSREGILAPEEAEHRVREVCMVALDPTDRVCGVTTAYLAESQHLHARLWHVRGTVGAAHRGLNVAAGLLIHTTRHLSDLFASGKDRRGLGIIMEMQNPGIERRFPFVVWPEVGFVFAGVTQGGTHLRLLWFPGARVVPPGTIS